MDLTEIRIIAQLHSKANDIFEPRRVKEYSSVFEEQYTFRFGRSSLNAYTTKRTKLVNLLKCKHPYQSIYNTLKFQLNDLNDHHLFEMPINIHSHNMLTSVVVIK